MKKPTETCAEGEYYNKFSKKCVTKKKECSVKRKCWTGYVRNKKTCKCEKKKQTGWWVIKVKF